jgi:CysZ protein
MAGEKNFRPPSGDGPGGLIAGLTYPFQALGVINRTRSLWRYILIPFGINLLVGVVLYASLLFAGFRFIGTTTAELPAAFQVILQVLLGIGLLILLGFVLVRFGVVLGSPWYGQLSERIEQIYTGRTLSPEPTSARTILRDIWRALAFELKKLLLVVVIGLPLLLLNFFPPFGPPLTSAGGIVLGVTIACLDFLDPPLERRRLRFRDKLGAIREALPASGGFGLICFGLITIPFLNLFSIPLCITAGTLFFCDQIDIDQR